MLTPGNFSPAEAARISQILRPYLILFARPTVRVCAIAVNGANADIGRFRRDLAMARVVWGQCGIQFAEGSFTNINADLDYPNWNDPTTAPAALLSQRGNCAPGEIRVYYVRSIGSGRDQGRTAFTFGEPGYVAMGDQAHPNLFPHELGHLFLGGNEEHRDGSSPADLVNIMRSDVGSIQGPPQVDQGQCTRARATSRGGRFASGSGHGQSGQTEAVQALASAAMHPSPAVRALAAAVGLQALAVMALRQR